MEALSVDIAVVGAGAAGLFAAIWAGRSALERGVPTSIVALDGARTLGAKILVAGGGRCNVTHHAVDETAYAGSSKTAIRQVLRRFDVDQTIEFFADEGVTLKREETGKLFPTTDDARSVLNALLSAARGAGVQIVHPWRVREIQKRDDGGFIVVRQPSGSSMGGSELAAASVIRAQKVILAAGGMALPKTGSDGAGYALARAFGHSITPHVDPALVPLICSSESQWLKDLSGLTLNATIELCASTGKKLASYTNSTLLTHFGLSGPGVLDISRYFTAARRADPGAHIVINWLPGKSFDDADKLLASSGKVSIARRVSELVPERLARALCERAGVSGQTTLSELTREQRRALVHQLTRCPIAVTGDRGFVHAEVTAGGIPLSEIHLATMESRVCPGLHLCGEICDVDGRIGGFNFQWAWASGFVAGSSAGEQSQARHAARP